MRSRGQRPADIRIDSASVQITPPPPPPPPPAPPVPAPAPAAASGPVAATASVAPVTPAPPPTPDPNPAFDVLQASVGLANAEVINQNIGVRIGNAFTASPTEQGGAVDEPDEQSFLTGSTHTNHRYLHGTPLSRYLSRPQAFDGGGGIWDTGAGDTRAGGTGIRDTGKRRRMGLREMALLVAFDASRLSFGTTADADARPRWRIRTQPS